MDSSVSRPFKSPVDQLYLDLPDRIKDSDRQRTIDSASLAIKLNKLICVECYWSATDTKSGRAGEAREAYEHA